MPKRHKLYPEPGAWVLDNYQGLPVTRPPDHPITEQLTARQIADEVEYHGLGVCIYSYIFPEKIQDKVLAEKWRLARKAMKAVVVHIDREDRKTTTQRKPVTEALDFGEEI